MLANARVSLWIHWDNNRECIKGERANKSTTASRLCVSSRFFYLDYIFWGDITVPLFFLLLSCWKTHCSMNIVFTSIDFFSTVILDWNRIDEKKYCWLLSMVCCYASYLASCPIISVDFFVWCFDIFGIG